MEWALACYMKVLDWFEIAMRLTLFSCVDEWNCWRELMFAVLHGMIRFALLHCDLDLTCEVLIRL